MDMDAHLKEMNVTGLPHHNRNIGNHGLLKHLMRMGIVNTIGTMQDT